jgi:RNA-directed DNA polymerase
MPTMRDRVVQGALTRLLDPLFAADVQDGSCGSRPGSTPQQAVQRLATAALHQSRVLEVDLATYCDVVRHDGLRRQLAARGNDATVLRLVTRGRKAGGTRGLSQGGVRSPLLANVSRTEGDRRRERAKRVTCEGTTTRVEYARCAD